MRGAEVPKELGLFFFRGCGRVWVVHDAGAGCAQSQQQHREGCTVCVESSCGAGRTAGLQGCWCGGGADHRCHRCVCLCVCVCEAFSQTRYAFVVENTAHAAQPVSGQKWSSCGGGRSVGLRRGSVLGGGLYWEGVQHREKERTRCLRVWAEERELSTLHDQVLFRQAANICRPDVVFRKVNGTFGCTGIAAFEWLQ